MRHLVIASCNYSHRSTLFYIEAHLWFLLIYYQYYLLYIMPLSIFRCFFSASIYIYRVLVSRDSILRFFDQFFCWIFVPIWYLNECDSCDFCVIKKLQIVPCSCNLFHMDRMSVVICGVAKMVVTIIKFIINILLWLQTCLFKFLLTKCDYQLFCLPLYFWHFLTRWCIANIV